MPSCTLLDIAFNLSDGLIELIRIVLPRHQKPHIEAGIGKKIIVCHGVLSDQPDGRQDHES